jgi:long-subunit fatty acid transport protein
LPSGSGARALGQGCAFTAVADDATAASWNPAGLMHLESPEASVVARFSREVDDHRSDSADLAVGRNEFSNESLNYFSLAWPFRVCRRNWVVSLNYQEAYDFGHHFTGDLRQRSEETTRDRKVEEFTENTKETQWDNIFEFNLDTESRTRSSSDIRQVLTSEMLTSVDFRQYGIVDAFSPALAADVTPRLSLGGALNLYFVNPARGEPIRSQTAATYSGTSRSESTVTTEQYTESTTHVTGWVHWEQVFPWLLPTPIVPGDVDLDPFSDTTTERQTDTIVFDGEYEESNEYHDFEGVNATLGMLWTLSRYLDVGATVDLPWSASALQTRSIRHKMTTYNEARTTVLSVDETSSTETRRIRLDFPLYCAVGALLRWSNRSHSALDVARTQWSDFAFQAEGGETVNPLDGSPYDPHRVNDCWTVCGGHEYLWVLRNTEIPFRGGAIWEQRPAVGEPDQYYGLTAGSGISIGKDPGKLILDFAYIYSWGDDVMGSLMPGQQGLTTDVRKHQAYASAVWHF